MIVKVFMGLVVVWTAIIVSGAGWVAVNFDRLHHLAGLLVQAMRDIRLPITMVP